MFTAPFSLSQLGWRPSFSQQLTLSDLDTSYVARVAAVHRSGLDVLSERGEHEVLLTHTLSQGDVAATVTVGDWLLVDQASDRVARVLERQSVLSRGAAGIETRVQLIAANIDSLFVVSACDGDFNLSRVERYLALAAAARIEPVLVLSKSDLHPEVEVLRAQLSSLRGATAAINLDCRSEESVQQLQPWLAVGQSVAVVGSSGVGKSTLINTLCGASQETASIRANDSKGRHTTTSRQLIAMNSGAWLIDTPGMRELKLGAISQGVREAFDDIEQLAQSCRFRNCSHEGDVGCAVMAAVADGMLEERRLVNYLKLQREALRARQALHERRAEERHYGRLYKTVQKLQRQKKGNKDS